MSDKLDLEPVELDLEALPPEKMSERVKRYAKNALKGLDYAGGAVRGTVGRASGLVTPEEYVAALKGEAHMPSSADMMERAGIPEVASLGDIFPSIKGEWYDPTARGAGGMALDVLTDPLTYLTGGATIARNAGRKLGAEAVKESTGKSLAMAAPRLVEMIASAPSKATRAVGDVLYKEGISPMAKIANVTGKDAADTFYRQGIGSWRNMGEKVQKAADKMSALREGLEHEADQLGHVDLRPARTAADDAMIGQVGKGMTKNEALEAAADLGERYNFGQGMKHGEAREIKSALTKSQHQKNFNAVQTKSPMGYQAGLKAGGSRAKTEIENSVGQLLGADKGRLYQSANSDLGTLLEVMDAARNASLKPMNKLDMADWLMISGELPLRKSGGITDPLVFGAKKIYDIYGKSMPGQTRMGYGMKRIADSPIAGPGMDAMSRWGMVRNWGPKKDEEKLNLEEVRK